MTDLPEPPPTPAERAEAAATRRRWITLAEAVAVAGVIIAALTLWMNWSDRHAEDQAKNEAAAIDSREKGRVDLSAEVESDGHRLALKDARHDLQDVTITFPRAFGISPQTPGGDPAIEADWFKPALLKATDGGADDVEGRLPVLIAAKYLDNDTERNVTGTYDIIWQTKGQRFAGRALTLKGLRLRSRGGTQAAIDAAWAKARPRP